MALSEQDLQIACVKWCGTKGIRIWHTPNGGHRSASEAGRMKVMGTLAGVPDLFIPALRLFVELKAPNGRGRLSKEQEALINELRGYGYGCLVTDSFEEFKEVVSSGLPRVV
jgi:hypothetical protein